MLRYQQYNTYNKGESVRFNYNDNDMVGVIVGIKKNFGSTPEYIINPEESEYGLLGVTVKNVVARV